MTQFKEYGLFDPFNITKVAEATIVFRDKVKASERPKITGSRDAVKILFPYFEDIVSHHEQFAILLLNRANRVTGYIKISQGGVAGTVADPKIIFQSAILGNASGVILCHNHPSGNLVASQADIDLTRKLKEAGKFLEIQVLDHIILTPEEDKYFSFADEGLM